MASIDVIIPVYNCKKYLEAAVASVLNQPCKNINIVIIDDGSTDGSAEICDHLSLAHNEVTVIHKPNGGVSSARNVGIEFVIKKYTNDLTHRYIASLDADDVWTNNFFGQETLAVLEKEYHLVGFQFCFCNKALTRCSPPTPMREGLHLGGTQAAWLYWEQ